MDMGFSALCTDFYVNQKLSLKMPLSPGRETIMHMFERVKGEFPGMDRLRKHRGELAIESDREADDYRWMAIRRQSIRTGHVNPENYAHAYNLHRMILQTSPYFLTISPLEVDSLELLYGFDFECKANHNDIVQEALIANTIFERLIDYPDARPINIQPLIGISLSDECDMLAYFEVKTRTTAKEITNDNYSGEPISVYLIIRRRGTVEKLEQLESIFKQLTEHGESLIQEKVLPELIQPISKAIITSTYFPLDSGNC